MWSQIGTCVSGTTSSPMIARISPPWAKTQVPVQWETALYLRSLSTWRATAQTCCRNTWKKGKRGCCVQVPRGANPCPFPLAYLLGVLRAGGAGWEEGIWSTAHSWALPNKHKFWFRSLAFAKKERETGEWEGLFSLLPKSREARGSCWVSVASWRWKGLLHLTDSSLSLREAKARP